MLRSMLRHERQTVAMELAAALHHSCGVRPDVSYSAPRGQKAASSGMRPALLSEVAEPQGDAVTPGVVTARAPLLDRVVPTVRGDDGVDGTTLRYLLKKSLAQKEAEEEEQERRREEKLRDFSKSFTRQQEGGGASGASSSSHPTRRKKKRKKKRRPAPGAYAKATGSHCSSCSSCACGKQVLQPFAAGLEATPVSVFVVAVNWNDYLGGITSDRHPDQQFLQGLRLPMDLVPTSPVIQYVPRCSMWRQFGCPLGGQCRQGSGPVWLVLGVLCYPGGVLCRY